MGGGSCPQALTTIVEVADLEDLERIQSQREHRHLQREMRGYATWVSSQIYYIVAFVSTP